MTRNKHPQTRADRLALKQKLDEKQKTEKADQVRRKLIKESLKQQETEDELHQYGIH